MKWIAPGLTPLSFSNGGKPPKLKPSSRCLSTIGKPTEMESAECLLLLIGFTRFGRSGQRSHTYREFSVLCAIYSAIGVKELAIVARGRIRRCALGYRSAAIMASELPKRTDQAEPLTERQLRDTIDRLHRNKFFARSTVARRITYYSIRLGPEALRKKILERRTYPSFFRATQSAADQALTDAINQRRLEPAKPVASGLSSPQPNR